MAKNKLQKFAENQLRDNIIQQGKPLYTTIKGRWNELYFKNNAPITLEVGCGYGEYTVGLAQHFLERNFIGADIKGNRLHRGSTQAINLKLNNVAFLRTKLEYMHEFFSEGELDEIWITFPDPMPKDYMAKRRLTSDSFLDMYKKYVRKNALIHLKTDSDLMYTFTKSQIMARKWNIIRETTDLYQSEYMDMHAGIETRYERHFRSLGYTIKYLVWEID